MKPVTTTYGYNVYHPSGELYTTYCNCGNMIRRVWDEEGRAILYCDHCHSEVKIGNYGSGLCITVEVNIT